MVFIPRKERTVAWAVAASDRARQTGGNSLVAAISASFEGFHDGRYKFNATKLRVETLIRRGAADHWVRSEYEKIAMLAPSLLDGAIAIVEREYRTQLIKLRRMEREITIWSTSAEIVAKRLDLKIEKLQHARIFLRWYRRYADQEQHPFSKIMRRLSMPLNHIVLEAAE